MGTFAPGLTPSQINSAEPAQWRQIVRQSLDDTRCASPAFLAEDMNSAKQTVTVQIAIQERVRPANGKAQWWDVPPIVNVPILVPRGGGYSMTLPLKKGDQGLLIFCDTCFDLWWQNGQTNAPTADNVAATASAAGNTPVPSGSQRQFEVRRHHVHDCGFAPGLWSQNNVLTDYSTDSLQIRRDDGSAIIDVADGVVSVKSNGGTPLALVNDNFYQWYTANIQPFLVLKGYVGPPVPLDSETTILKGQ
jgi:hypothetical protein